MRYFDDPFNSVIGSSLPAGWSGGNPFTSAIGGPYVSKWTALGGTLSSPIVTTAVKLTWTFGMNLQGQTNNGSFLSMNLLNNFGFYSQFFEFGVEPDNTISINTNQGITTPANGVQASNGRRICNSGYDSNYAIPIDTWVFFQWNIDFSIIGGAFFVSMTVAVDGKQITQGSAFINGNLSTFPSLPGSFIARWDFSIPWLSQLVLQDLQPIPTYPYTFNDPKIRASQLVVEPGIIPSTLGNVRNSQLPLELAKLPTIKASVRCAQLIIELPLGALPTAPWDIYEA